MNRLAILLVLMTGLFVGCGGGDTDDTTVILAASSATGYLDDFVIEHRRANPDAGRVEISYGGSNALVQQARDGAPAHILITADRAQNLGIPPDLWPAQEWVSNELVIAVPTGNPGRVDALTDLTTDNLRIAICAPEVPCGRALGDRYGDLAPDSAEPSVRSVLSKVQRNEVDAGIVFRTDANAAGQSVEIVAITPAPATTYEIFNLAPGHAGADYWQQVLATDAEEYFVARGFSPGREGR